MREHLPPTQNDDPSLPLVVITYHPGFAAGSYEDRDYFELLTPLLFSCSEDRFRLRVFTVNHPGYDLPDRYKVNRFDLETFSIRYQPLIIEQVLRWLLTVRFAGEKNITLIPYGHSMGGVALAQTNMQPLLADAGRQGCRVQVQKVLSAPAFALHENLKRNLNKVQALKTLKITVGRAPLYERITRGLFEGLAPIVYRRDAGKYSLNPDCTFPDFRHYNPFILLDQGLELLKLSFSRERMASLMGNSHLILCTDDGMVDSNALRDAAGHANGRGAPVQVHTVRSSHNPERDDPQLVRDTLCSIIQPHAAVGN